jgi:GTPase involved in cell partitioning and DNA repair
MKNIFDLRAKEKFLREREIELNVKDATYSARWVAKELEKKNEIAELELKHRKELAELEAKYSKELLKKDLFFTENQTDLNCVHKEQLAELREELKKELGIKAIDLEKQLSILEERERLLYTEIDDLRSDNARLEKELKEMTATALKYAEKSAEVRVVEPQIITPQILESKINVIPTCKG